MCQFDELVSGVPECHRDDKGSGKIVKRDDHLMDATRYLIVSGRLQMQLPPEPEPPPRFEYYRGPDAWMQ